MQKAGIALDRDISKFEGSNNLITYSLIVLIYDSNVGGIKYIKIYGNAH